MEGFRRDSHKLAFRFNLKRCNFSNFPGGMPPDPPSAGMLHMPVCFTCLCASHTMSVNMPASPTSTMITGLAVLPFSKV